ncbi:MAG: hypothetical protein HC934_07260, partial [Acaryochloridaceae cyanobacterium SU_2_1]|nr:hypothetical protein [Acaryochloridaceae cyanobacterium SU_2_1]
DQGPKEKSAVKRAEFVSRAATILDEMQQTLRQRALDLRASATREIDTLDEFKDFFADMIQRGFVRARVDGEVVKLTDDLKLDKRIKHTIEIVVDRLKARSG